MESLVYLCVSAAVIISVSGESTSEEGLSGNAVLEIRNQLNTMQGQMDDLQEENHQLRMELNAVKTKNLDLLTHMKSMNSRNDLLSNELESVKAQQVEQAITIGSLKAQNNDLANLVDEGNKEIDILKAQNVALSHDLNSIKTQVNYDLSRMERQSRLVSDQMNSLQIQTAESAQQVNQLRAAQRAGEVSFSTYLIASGDYNSGNTIIFDGIISNFGNVYNPETGHFVCPLSAYYMFFVNIRNNRPSDMKAALTLDGSLLLNVEVSESTNGDYASNLVVTLCQTDQVVQVECTSDGDSLLGSKTSSFSGMLLYLAS